MRGTRKAFCLLLAAALMLTMILPARAQQVTEPVAQTTAPTETVGETTAPTEIFAETEPDTMEPPETRPEETQPPETEPEATGHAETESAETEPTETEPPETEPAETEPEETEPEIAETTQPQPPLITLPAHLEVTPYFGLLHAHTDLSDGLGTVEEAFACASDVENMDFFGVTDHSNSFDNADDGAIDLDGTAISADWARGKEAALAVTCEDFVGIFGYEMTWQEDRGLGHISTYNTPGWQSRNQKEFRTLEAYYEALTTVPGSVSQFNHPGPDYGEFENFAHWSAGADEAMALLEVGGEGGFTAYDYYTTALDAGWHVAPAISQNNHNGNWGREGEGRTVILAQALTEECLYEAMGQRRVYATEDSNLGIVYTLDEQLMGSVVPAGDSHTISLWIWDASEEPLGLIEVIGSEEQVLYAKEISGCAEERTIRVPGGSAYYYLRITQQDGDVAVTAPVWAEGYENIGVASFEADKQVPVQGETVTLKLNLFNEEMVPFRLESAAFYAEDAKIQTLTEPGTVEPGSTLALETEYVHSGLGAVTFRAEVTGTLAGQTRSLEAELTLSYRSEKMVSDILVDGSHGPVESGELSNLGTVAEQANMGVTLFSRGLPEEGKLLIVPAPESAFEDSFVKAAGEFVRKGGCLVVCGSSEHPDASTELNRLLEAAGSTMRLRPDAAVDEVNNGGDPKELYPAEFNRDSDWGRKISKDQFYVHRYGCTVDKGKGTWLVRGFSTTVSSETGEKKPVLLACEFPETGGTVVAAGCPFLWDENMPLPKNKWDPPRANQTILELLLGLQKAELKLDTIADVRKGETGKVYRIKGYATTGTSNVHTTFPDLIYIQDSTGGIALTPFSQPGIQIGTPVEAVGYLDLQDGNPVLEVIDFDLPQEAFYRHVPRTLNNSRAMNYKTNGGKLVQVEAEVTAVTLTDDGKGVCRFALKDEWDDEATVLIEDFIHSGSGGENTLAEDVKIGRTVRAMGILHLDENGIPVVRVRNCEEVVYVPPLSRPNPFTGDRIGIPAALGLLSLTLAVWLLRKRGKGEV